MFQSEKSGKHNKIGAYGEKIAEMFLMKQGFVLIERNFLQKCGEIDLIMEKDGVIHFIEVKTVSFVDQATLKASYSAGYRPEEQLTAGKYNKLAKTIAIWLSHNGYMGEYQLDLATVRLVEAEKYAAVEYFERITP